ncbi:hypothetical protein F5Y12DRAFT_748371 [Xylaria sp. FL1777]|nr:hypothetical protein F5Y12DRAFT_748371 [Xylaria sp. FL1777]
MGVLATGPSHIWVLAIQALAIQAQAVWVRRGVGSSCMGPGYIGPTHTDPKGCRGAGRSLGRRAQRGPFRTHGRRVRKKKNTGYSGQCRRVRAWWPV